jgi:hypothetical protein
MRVEILLDVVPAGAEIGRRKAEAPTVIATFTVVLGDRRLSGDSSLLSADALVDLLVDTIGRVNDMAAEDGEDSVQVDVFKAAELTEEEHSMVMDVAGRVRLLTCATMGDA